MILAISLSRRPGSNDRNKDCSYRRDEVLAFVIEWIARRDIAPSFGNIIREQKMSDTRAKQLVAQGKVEQISGDVRSIRVRDVASSRN